MRAGMKRRVGLFLGVLCLVAVGGAALGSVSGSVFRGAPVHAALVGAITRPLACFFGIEQALEQPTPEFERDFGAVPRLRAALHAGPVIAGEVGESRRAAAAWPRRGGMRVRGHGQAVTDGRPGTIYVN